MDDSNYNTILNNLLNHKNKKRNYLDYLSDINPNNNNKKFEREFINIKKNGNNLSLKDEKERIENLCYNPFRLLNIKI